MDFMENLLANFSSKFYLQGKYTFVYTFQIKIEICEN